MRETEGLEGNTLIPAVPFGPRNLRPASDEGAPVADLGRGAEIASVDEERTLSPRDALGNLGMILQPSNRVLQIGPVRRDKNNIRFRRGVLHGP